MRYLCVAIVLVCLCACAFADDIVSMPTANQLKAGEVDAAAYYLTLKDSPSKFVQYQTLYVGLTDRFEIDAHRTAIDNNKTATVLVASAKLLSESPKTPDLVFGIRNLAGATTIDASPDLTEKSKDRSFFLSAAKTFFFNPAAPGPPLVRAHLSLGTADWTLFGEERHKGLFGGLQFLFAPWLGAVVEQDGQDVITGITIMPKNSGLTIKGGTYGDHSWIGLAWRKDLY